MTTETYTTKQLAQILSALAGTPRNPATKAAAERAIQKEASRFGLDAAAVYEAAPGLLDGRVNDEEFRAMLTDAEFRALVEEDVADDEPAEDYIMPNAGPLAVADDADPLAIPPALRREAPTGDDGAEDAADEGTGDDAGDDAPSAPTAAHDADEPAKPMTVRRQLLIACMRAADVLHQHEIEADTLAQLHAAIARAEGQQPRRERAPRTPREPRPAREPRGPSKQDQVLDMLRRPQGATIAQIAGATGWLNHTVHGFFAGAVKKKLGLNLVSEKLEEGGRVYRLAD